LARGLAEPIAELADGFPWQALQAAPPDQRTALLRGDEWLRLEGLTASHFELVTRLPFASASAWVSIHPGQAPRPVRMQADRLLIDGDTERCSLVFRGAFPVAVAAELQALRFTVGVASTDAPIDWRQAREREVDPSLATTLARAPRPVVAAPPRPAEIEEPDPLEGTMALGSELPLVAATPWERGGDVPTDASEADPLEGTLGLSSDFVAKAPMPWSGATGAPPRPAPPEAVPALPFRPVQVATAPPVPPLAPPALEPDHDASPELGGTLAGSLVVPAAQSATPFPLAPAQRALAPAFIPGAPWCAPALAAAPVPLPSDDPLEATMGLASVLGEVARAGAEGLEAESQPATAKRSGKTIPVANASELATACLFWQLEPGRPSATVIVKGSFVLGAGGVPARAPEPAPPTADRHLGDDPAASVVHPGDFAVVKPRADVTLAGHAHAPGGSATEMRVRFRFGREGAGFDRELAVFGPRAWQGDRPGAPAPFDRVPLVWERASRGPVGQANPVGVGTSAAGADAADGAALPQLEDAKALVARPGDAPAPACFAPIAPGWSPRRDAGGTYDAAWRERWPYFPADFDRAFFQHAPAAQQVRVVVGDEPFELHGLHSEHAVVRGALPGVRARCFAQHLGAAPPDVASIEGFREVKLLLDSVHFDLDGDRLHLVWRGLLPLRDPRGRDIESLFVVEEPVRGPAVTLSEARTRYAAHVARLRPLPKALAAAEGPANTAGPSGAGALALAAAGETRAAALAPLPHASPAPPPPPLPPDASAGPPPPDARRAEVEARLARGASLAGLDLARADLSELDLAGAKLGRARLRLANLARARLAGADLSEAQLAGANLCDADLAEAVLERADLEGARLDRAVVRGARLGRASLEQASAVEADFEAADARGASFARAELRGARFVGAELGGADFTDAQLDDAVLDGARARELRLYGASGRAASFRGAELADARADEARLPGAVLDDARAIDSVWERAVLEGSSLAGTDLTGASLVGTTCTGADFSRSKLVGARLDEAALAGCRFGRANLMRAGLVGADLSGADLAGASLFQADTWKAVLTDAVLTDAP
ncbi:MAG: DUF2169 domain-containing protein, partial [Polyangiaceae bacterium]|nr:DUF2169 domain-containing protein [Polyangiaceae bacterium]